MNAAGHIETAAASRDGELLSLPTSAHIRKRITDAGFKGIWVDIANPCDVVSTEIQYLTGCDPTESSARHHTDSAPSVMRFPWQRAILQAVSMRGCLASMATVSLLCGRT